MARDVLDKHEVLKGSPQRESRRKPRKQPAFFRLIVICAFILIAAFVGGGAYFVRSWPFTEANVIQQLEQATSSRVRFKNFRRIYFPRPGCIAEGVRFERGSDPNHLAVMTVETLSIEGNLTRLFYKHLALIRATGAHAMFPPVGSGESWKPTPSDIIVDELIANEALVDFLRHNPKQPPVRFVLHDFVVHHMASHDPAQFEARLDNPTPPGQINASGSFGPWNLDHVEETPVSGHYAFRNADLGVFEGIQGILSADGQFNGELDSIAVEGTTDTPNFMVRDSAHKVDLKTRFRAQVDSTNGDVQLDSASAQVRRTRVYSRGSVAEHTNEDGKTATLDLAVSGGQIQDLLLLFVSEPQAPLNGAVTLSAKTRVAPSDKPFLRRIELTGDFGIDNGSFAKPETQEDLAKLSAAAQGDADHPDDPERTISDLGGHIDVRDGVANFTDLSFRVPGAVARLHGTYNLISQRIDLHGMLSMQANLPRATSGVKSFLLKFIDPFLKKNHRGGAKFPVSITGTYKHPKYSADPI